MSRRADLAAAITMFGHADQSDLALVLNELPADFQERARIAHEWLRPVAYRLQSHRISQAVRLQLDDMVRNARGDAPWPPLVAEWDAPPPDIISHVLQYAEETPWEWACQFEQLNHAWRTGVLDWRRDETRVVLTRRASDRALRCVSRCCPSLRTLEVYLPPDPNSVPDEGRSLSEQRQSVTDLAVRQVVHGCPNLRDLVLRHCGCVTDVALSHIAHSLSELRTLDVAGCADEVTASRWSEALSELAATPNLERLTLHGCTLLMEDHTEALVNLVTRVSCGCDVCARMLAAAGHISNPGIQHSIFRMRMAADTYGASVLIG